MKIDRLLGILTTLSNKDKLRAKDLADKFEVSIRTIYRDIEDICKAGIPIITYPGGDGGISISEGYNLDKSILSTEELSNILIGLKSLESISQGSQVKLLVEKLTPNKNDILTVNDNIFIDLTSFYKPTLSNKITILKEAITNSFEVCFNYFSSKGMSRRVIAPYFITFKWSAWYIYGYCNIRKDFRLFKLNRMDALETTETKFTVRNLPIERTELDNYFKDPVEIVTILLHPSLEYQIVEAYGTNSYEYTKDNSIKFNLEYTNHDYAIQTILGFGDKAKVISPQHIIDEIKQYAENIFSLYK